MAVTTPTRRGLLCAIAAAPVVAAVSTTTVMANPLPAPMKVAPDGGRWWRTFERYTRAEAVTEQWKQANYDPVWKAFVEANGGCIFRDTPERQALSERLGLGPVEDRYERMADVCLALHDRLLALPAPDARAAIWKLDYLMGAEEGTDGTPCWSKSFSDPIVADIKRFVGGEA